MRFVVLYILLILSLFVHPKEHYYFSNFSLEDGLSQITVTSIFQDSKGYMWFGTRNGLNRFNGYSFEVFMNDKERNSISDNHILCITEDDNKYLWVGTNNGLNRIDLSSNTFKRYFSHPASENTLSNNLIPVIYKDSRGNIWVGTHNGLNLYQPDSETFSRIYLNGLLNNNPINTIAEREGKLYLGTSSKGCIVFDLSDNSGSLLHKESYVFRDRPHSENIRTIVKDRWSNLWMGTYQNGVYLFRPDKNELKHYSISNGLTNNYIRCIRESPDGSMLIGTFNGLNSVDPVSEEIVQYKTYDSGKGNLSHYSIYSICFDSSGTLWIGTYAGGIDYYNPYSQKFRFYNPASELKTIVGINGPMVETERYLYVATEGGGLLEMNKDGETFRHYRIYNDSENSYAKNILKSLFLDGSSILCGTNVGTVYRFDLNSRSFSLLYDLKKENAIYHIGRRYNGDLIIGGVNDIGMTFISPHGETRNKFPVKNNSDFLFFNVRCISEIEPDIFLIGTRNDGLFYYNLKKQELTRYNSNQTVHPSHNLPENYISCIFRDSKGSIWIGTFGGGFCNVDLSSQTVSTFDIKDGLLDNSVCAIIEDDNHTLWISTISGISRFNPETRFFENYTHSSGIKINEFTIHSGIKLSDDRIFYGGNNGFVAFNPYKMATNPFIPPVVLEDLLIHNEKIEPSAENSILTRQLNEQPSISLKYNETNLAISYSALNYIFSDRNQYAYMLEGFDNEWNYVGSRRIAYYTNIPPGRYIFKVKASNNDGVWNEEGKSIEIIVSPPFWKTWWAYLAYIVLTGMVLYFIFRYFKDKERLNNEIRLKQMEAKTQDEFHQARNRLFTNFSHELRTPLTLIMSPLDDIAEHEELRPDIKDRMQTMQSNSRRLLRLVNNLMDFQKNESGNLKIKVSRNNIIEFSKEMCHLFDDMANSRNIRLLFYPSTEKADCLFDKNLMEKVFFNLLSNAFKNTPDSGKIEVHAKLNRLSDVQQLHKEKCCLFTDNEIDYLLIEIEDTGSGIPSEDLEKIFTPFYQVSQSEHAHSGTGLGLSLSKSIIEMHHGVVWAESKLGKSSCFKFILPLSDDLYKQEEIQEEETAVSSLYQTIDISSETISETVSEERTDYLILIVEDNPDVRRYLVSRLSDLYNIMEATNGEEGLTKAFNHLPDLILTDLMMPKMNGIEMTTKLKSDLRTSHVPVVMLTARTMPADMLEGYDTGADDYIVKPFNTSVLKARIRNILQSREKLKEIYGKRFDLKNLGVKATSLDEKFMQQLYDIIEKDISNPQLDFNQFYQHLGMSRANFYRKIKAITNLTLSEVIRNVRLETAAKLLKEGGISVSDVYHAVGFNSHAYFSNCFKVVYGVSPSEYAKQENEERTES